MVAPRISRGRSPSDRDTYDPVLDKVVTDATFDCDWPELRERLRSALLAALPLFQSIGPPKTGTSFTSPPPAPSLPSTTPTSTSTTSVSTTKLSTSSCSPGSDSNGAGKPPTDSLLLSPSQRPIELEPEIGPEQSTNDFSTNNHVGLTSSSSFASSSSALGSQDMSMQTDDVVEMDPSLRPSTPGGLVIAPFPPLDPSRRKSRSGSMQLEGGAKTNMNGGLPGSSSMAGRKRPMQLLEDYDEEVVIGGRKLQGWMEEEEAKTEVNKIAKKIDELAYPPFTLQRLAELLLTPTLSHKSLGKFLRAVDKTLGVTTPFQSPSYTYIPPSTLTPRPPLSGFAATLSSEPTTARNRSRSRSRSRSGSVISVDGPSGDGENNNLDDDDEDEDDIDSTVPPGSTTPMFSPIPFLPVHSEEEGTNGLLLDMAPRSLDEGLMSPLMLGDESTNGTFFGNESVVAKEEGDGVAAGGSGSGGRSPTPEPEEDVKMTSEGSEERTTSSGSEKKAETSPNSMKTSSSISTPELNVTRQRASIEDSADPANQPFLGRVDELDSGPITTPPSLNGHGNERGIGEEVEGEAMGRNRESGTLVSHGMNERPVALSATTVISANNGSTGAGELASLEGRQIAPLPRAPRGTQGDEAEMS